MSNTALINAMLAGGMIVAAAGVALFFLRFWRRSRDRLFLWFAIAFFVQALDRLALSLGGGAPGEHIWIYGVRFVGFAMLLVAIIDKNRS